MDLLTASETGNLRRVESLLREGADPNEMSDEGDTPLMIAISTADEHMPEEDPEITGNWGNLNIVRALLEAGADPNLTGEGRSTPLIMAISDVYDADSSMFVRALLEAGAEPNNHSLILAAQRAITTSEFDREMYVDIINMLLNKDVDINAKGIWGNTSLILTSRSGDRQLARLFLEKGADPNIQNRRGDTALIYAVMNRNVAIIRSLLEAGADIGILIDRFPEQQLTVDQLVDSVRMLLDLGAEPNIRDKTGNTALTKAVRDGYVDIVKMLLEAGADIGVVTEDGETIKSILANPETPNREEILDLFKQYQQFVVNVLDEEGLHPNLAKIMATQLGLPFEFRYK